MGSCTSKLFVAAGLILGATPVSAQVVVAPPAPRPSPTPTPSGTVVVRPAAGSTQSGQRSGTVVVTPTNDRRDDSGRATRPAPVVVRPAQTSGETMEREFQPASIGPFCPTRVLRGDREFGGGPEIWTTASIAVTRANTVELTLNYRAREPRPDWTETEGTWRYLLTPPTMRVKSILSETKSELYVNTGSQGSAGVNYAPAIFGAMSNGYKPNYGDLIMWFHIVGDTNGDDISTDDDCKDDTSVALMFNPLKLEVYK